MDRNYYYRILGVRSDATPAQIKAAYDARIARLSSLDYADEPEYAKRKKEQANKAYKVLMGVAPVETRVEKRSKKAEKVVSRSGSAKMGAGSSGSTKITATTVITIAIAIIGLCSSLLGIMGDSSYESSVIISEETMMQIENAESLFGELDYYANLDTGTITENSEAINWDEGWGEFGVDPLSAEIDFLVQALNIEDTVSCLEYITDDVEYHYDYDDYDLAYALIGWMGAPDFYDVAGATNSYTGEPILCLSDYISYLREYVSNHDLF